MRKKRTGAGGVMRSLAAWSAAGILAAGLAFAAAQARAKDNARPKPDIAALVTPLNDLQAGFTVSRMETKELDKIGKDFGLVYRLKHLTVFYKEPEKTRMEGSSRVLGDGLLIINGNLRFYSVPKLNIRTRETIAADSTKRQSLLEWGGILSKDTLRFMQGEFVQNELLGSTPAVVYDLRYKAQPTGMRYRVWLDSKTHITLKREWYDGANALRATFLYSEPKEIAPGVWLPTQCEVKNGAGAAAATLSIKDIKVNQKLDDSLFEIKP